MRQRVRPLPQGTLIQDRFELGDVLGQGGFGIVYMGWDQLRKETVVIKELAPDGVTRDENGQVLLDELGRACAHRLRRHFLDEARILSKLNLPGVPKIRASAAENGTVYYICEYCNQARTAAAWVAAFGPLSEEEALRITTSLAETLAAVHEKGILHRDIKPQNILLRQGHPPVLIDFGSAREWHADRTDSQTSVFTPGYAPLEMYSESGMRGPASDVFGLAASAYFLLTGTPPPPVVDRMNGVKVQTPIAPGASRPSRFVSAIMKGMALRIEDRPASMEEFSQLMVLGEPASEAESLEELDQRLLELNRLKAHRKQCPVCSEIMSEPRPLRRDQCPVCRRGTIKKRQLHDRTCPVCRIGVLNELDNESHPEICPICASHKLERHTRGFIHRSEERRCKGCGAILSSTSNIWTLADNPNDADRIGETREWSDWRGLSHRANKVMLCDSCDALFDIRADGRWQQVSPEPGKDEYSLLYPEEWARVASQLDPGCGTHVCAACEADYFIDENSFTLLASYEDPYGFAERFLGRHLTLEQSRWVGSGKMSPRPGPTCTACGTEFDREGDQWRLIRTSSPALRPRADELRDPQDWHRLARGLPCQTDEQTFLKRLDSAVRQAYLDGEMDIDGKGAIWRGGAVKVGPQPETSTLVGSASELSFGPLLRKVRIGTDEIAAIDAHGDSLLITFRNPEMDPMQFTIDPIELTAPLKSGDRTIRLTAVDLCERVRLIMDGIAAEQKPTIETVS